jgi:dienelactone hydrolase
MMNARLGSGLMAVAVLLALGSARAADVKTKEVTYKQGDTELTGFFAWDDAAKGKRPGVIVVHEFWGHNEHARNQAKRLAEAGYVAFALDMYGKGKVTTHPEDAQKFMAEATKDAAVMTARFNAALAQLKQDPHVDPEKIAAIGYCFGGRVVTNMARAGADLDAVVSFHGALDTQTPVEKGKVKARVLICTGGADPLVTADTVQTFEKQMKDAGAKIEVITFPGVKHSFTNPDAAKAGMDAVAYDADADKKSFAAMLKMFDEVFGTSKPAGQ